MRLDIVFGKARAAARRGDAQPQRLLILADLVGQARDDIPALSERRIVRVSLDNLDQILAACAPSIRLGAGEHAGANVVRFRTIEDFHPDELFEKTGLFEGLLQLRRRLEDPGGFAAAAAELKGGIDEPSPADRTDRSAAAGAAEASPFERLLGKDAGTQPQPSRPPETAAAHPLDRMIRALVAPYVVAAPDPQQSQLIAAVDAALGDAMREVLHAPAFQALEAAWRGIHWLLAAPELGEGLELYLLHARRDELAGSALHRLLVDNEARTAGGLRFSALIGDYRFGATLEDVATLEELGRLATDAGAPFVAGAECSLLGGTSIAEQPDPHDWQEVDPEVEQRFRALRADPVARSIALALPRFLLRLPYGEKVDPIERFRFEELSARPSHRAFLWGNGALACARVMARGHQAPGVADHGEIEDLPAFVFSEDGEPKLKPCAEVCLSERAATAILDRGLVPLLSYRDRNAVRLVRIQSLAGPTTAVA